MFNDRAEEFNRSNNHIDCLIPIESLSSDQKPMDFYRNSIAIFEFGQ